MFVESDDRTHQQSMAAYVGSALIMSSKISIVNINTLSRRIRNIIIICYTHIIHTHLDSPIFPLYIEVIGKGTPKAEEGHESQPEVPQKQVSVSAHVCLLVYVCVHACMCVCVHVCVHFNPNMKNGQYSPHNMYTQS